MGRSRIARLAGALALVTLGVAHAARPGQVENRIVDAGVDGPTRSSRDVFDVYQVIVDWLARVEPQGSEAKKAVDAMATFVAKTKELRARGVAPTTVESPMELDALVAKLRAEPPRFAGELAQNPKAQAYTALLLPFLQLRGISFRCRPLVERSFPLHTALLDTLRATKHELDANGSSAAMAVFEFLTYPLPQSDARPVQFHKVSELQAWCEANLIPTLDVSIRLAEAALAAASDATRETVDLALFLRPEAIFPEPALEPRDRAFGKPELENLLACGLGARAGLKLFCAWNLDEAIDASNEVSRAHIEGFLAEKVPFGQKPRIGVTSADRYAIYRRFGSLFTLRAAAQSRAALEDARQAFAHFDKAETAWLAAPAPEGDDRVANLRYIQASRREYQVKVAPQIRAALAGPATLTDYVGGSSVDLDLPGFLANPPQDLKAFFPKDFDTAHPTREMRFRSGPITYSNYDHGNPLGWDQAAAAQSWKRLFPGIGDDRSAAGHWIAPMRLYRDLSRTYVGGLLGPLVALVVD